MADLKTVIANLKAQQQSSQNRQVQAPVQAPAKVEVKEDAEDLLDDEDDPTGEVEETNQVPVQETPQIDGRDAQRRADIEKQQAIEMELLQNNGRFRAELLYQMQELNKALVVIAEILVKR